MATKAQLVQVVMSLHGLSTTQHELIQQLTEEFGGLVVLTEKLLELATDGDVPEDVVSGAESARSWLLEVKTFTARIETLNNDVAELCKMWGVTVDTDSED